MTAFLLALGFAGLAWLVAILGGGYQLPAYRWALLLPLVVLALLDARSYWLPFSVTIPLVLLGLWAAVLDGMLPEALAGCLLWGGVTAGLATWFRHMRGRTGLGFGDIVLMAAIGAWAGATAGAVAIVLASVAALLVSLAARGLGLSRGRRWPRLPLGTLLCLGLWATMLVLGSAPVATPVAG